MRNLKITILTFVFSLFTMFLCSYLLFPVSFAHAQENVLRLSPAYIDVSVKDPLEQVEVEFTLENRSNAPLSIELFPLDFHQKDDLGTIGFLGRALGNYTYGLSSFVSFENRDLELNPGEKKVIPVTIINRQDLTPGGHYAAIIARTKPEGAENTDVSLAVSGLIYLTKTGGERYNASLKEVSYTPAFTFSYPTTAFLNIQNDGNVHVIPYGTADVYDMFGRKIYTGIINEPSVKVLPQSIRRVPVYFKQAVFSFPISINTLKIQGHDSQDKVSFATQEVFVYINPVMIGGILLFVILGIFILRKRRKD